MGQVNARELGPLDPAGGGLAAPQGGLAGPKAPVPEIALDSIKAQVRKETRGK